MIPLFTEDQFKESKSKDSLPCKCKMCDCTFGLSKHNVQRALNTKSSKTGDYCSPACSARSRLSRLSVSCRNCGATFEKASRFAKKSPNHFCSRSCAATYNNKNKTSGNRRSKLEMYLEDQLTSQYPSLDLVFNSKEAIGSELDIYIPSLKLAFELNGIFHYEPIYGPKKLDQIQSNDSNKFHKCHELNISLCIIDTSQQKYFKESTSKRYLDIVTSIINQRTTPLIS